MYTSLVRLWVALTVGLNEDEEMRARICGCDAFAGYPFKVLARKERNFPFACKYARFA